MAIKGRLFKGRVLRLWAISATFVAFVFLGGAGTAADVKPRDARLEIALVAWETSAARLHSYDLLLRVNTTNMTEEIHPTVSNSKELAAEPRLLPPGKEPSRVTEFTRQILSKQGKRRCEYLDPKGESWSHARVFDGEVVRWLSRNGLSAGVSPGPDKAAFVSFHSNYGALYRDLPLGGTIVPLLRSRKGTRLVKGHGGEDNYVIIESLPEEGTRYPKLGLEIALDPNHGMMPARIESGFRTLVQPRSWRMTIDKFHEVEPGIWVPVAATYRWGPPDEVFSIIKVVVDMGRSHWNQPVSDDLFTLAFPVGTQVKDDLRGLFYKTGKPDKGKNVDDLLEGARQVIPLPARSQPK